MEHSRFGYSAVNDFKLCPYKYDLAWNKQIEMIPDNDPQNPLLTGTAIHKAIETNFETAEKEYFENFNVIDDRHITEMMKVQIQSNKVKQMIQGSKVFHETRIEDGEFIGTIDLLEYVSSIKGKKHFNMYDFKYSNNVSNYQKSAQLTIYKHYFEKIHPDCVIDKMGFIIIPKTNIKQRDDESVLTYRRRIKEDLKNPFLIESKYDSDKLNDFFKTIEEIKRTKVFPKTENQFCSWCKYNNLCMKGDNTMVLPSTDRRQVTAPTRRKIWVYGATMSGKTTLVDSAPNPLNLNTDGNIQFVSMPYVAIKNEVKVEGRITNTKLAWEVFKEAIAELEKGSDFKTIVVDLLEDTYESCRLYMYDKLGITHESDDSFKAWDKVRTEYLSTIRRLMNLDYENIVLISHEDTSKDITKKSGDKITSIRPNIPEKISNKIAGMVDIVARVVVEDDGTRTLNFKSNEVIFGGGRLKGLQVGQIPLDWNELMNVYSTSQKPVKNDSEASQKPSRRQKKEEPVEVVEPVPTAPEFTIEPPFSLDDEVVSEPVEVVPTPVQEEAPKRRTRRTRG